MEDFEDTHCFFVFDLTSTEKARESSKLFLELTGSSFTLKLYFSTAFCHAIGSILLGEPFSQFSFDSALNVSKNSLLDWRLVFGQCHPSKNWEKLWHYIGCFWGRTVVQIFSRMQAADGIIQKSAMCQVVHGC